MRANPTLSLLAACLLAGCNENPAADTMHGKSPGRYSGIGTFGPGRLWQEMAGAPASQDPKAANLADDEQIIVVLDSHTGEVRQCGNHSGVCVAMNPWKDTGAPIAVPTPLARHAADLDAEGGQTAQADANAVNIANEAAPAR